MLIQAEAVLGKELKRHSAFRVVPVEAVAFGAVDALATAATYELVYLSATEDCFINLNAAATTSTTFLARGVFLPVRLEEEDVIHVLGNGLAGTLTLSGAT